MMNNAEKLIEKYQMFKEGDSVLVGLSGGADSVTLLCFLKELKLGLKLYACHINHGIRGEEAERDEQFCRDFCERKDIPFFCERISVPALAKQRKCSEETVGRDERYRIFGELAEKLGAKIAVAHNRDDLAETALFNIIRGTSADGVCALKPVRGNIYRPLLSVSRIEIESYLKEKGESFVEDSTNKEECYTRNKIRHSVLREMKKINKSATEHIAYFTETLRDDCDFLNAEAEKAYTEMRKGAGLSDKLLEKPNAVITRVIARFLEENSTEVSRDNINSLKEVLSRGGKVNLSGNSFYTKRGGYAVRIVNSDAPETIELSEGQNSFGEVKITLSFVDLEEKKGYNERYGKVLIDAEKLEGKLFARSRRAGDKFYPLGRTGKTLKKFFNEQKIIAEKRNLVPIITDEKGIVAVLPKAIDKRVAPSSDTKRLLIIETDME